MDLGRNVEHSGGRTDYVSGLRSQLKQAYEQAISAAWQSQSNQRNHYDKRVRGAVLEVGDRVQNVGIKGTHKLTDRWSEEVFVVVAQPSMDIPSMVIPVFEVKPETGTWRFRTHHRNLLLPIPNLPLDIEV